MPTSLTRMLKRIESTSSVNRPVLLEFYEYMHSKEHTSKHHIISLLGLLISLDKFFSPLPFTSIEKKEQILAFLNHREVDGKWVEREHDAEGKYITSFNFYLVLLKIFFRWLSNKDKPDDQGEWETPPFLKIKAKKPLRDSPYGINDIWELEDILTIVGYEPELRNQAIITLLWDLDARPHEITALRVKDIVLNERYGEGIIPSNTKTGGGPCLLISSFTYVRDWINKHPFKNEPNARLICSLHNGAPIKPERIREILDQLKLRIKRLVEEAGGEIDEQQKQKLEHLLRAKKWNPYCIRHSAITEDSDHLPEYALTKKVRWVMGSEQPKRYIKRRMGNDLKNQILHRYGIVEDKQSQPVSRTCGRCGHINNLHNKFCEKAGCSYPLTQMALDEIKAAEEVRVQEMISKSNQERDNTIQELQQKTQSLSELCKHSLELSSKQNNTISDQKSMIDDVMSKYDKLMGEYNDLKGLLDKSMSTTETALEGIDELQSFMSGGLLIKPGRGTAEEI